MPTASTNPLEARLIATNVGYFLREFSISQTKYTPPGRSEIELADQVILIDDVLFLIQAKNRDAPSSDEVREAKWYRDVVKRQAVQQLRSTLIQLQSVPPLPNDYDEATHIPRDLGQLRVFKFVIYKMGEFLPASLRQKKHRLDQDAGFIHLFHIDDYELVLRTLVTLPEVIGYLDYREAAVQQYGSTVDAMSERALLGSYLRFDTAVAPTEEHARFVDDLLTDIDSFDISGLLRDYRSKVYRHSSEGPLPGGVHTSSSLGPYHAVLRQLLRLSRPGLAKFKERFMWAREKCDGEIEIPSLFAMIGPEHNQRDGFVFIPIPKGANAKEAHNALVNLTKLGKYKLQADRMLGISLRRDGRDFLIDWALVQHPWQPNSEIDEMLRTRNPFRDLSEAEQPRYHFRS